MAAGQLISLASPFEATQTLKIATIAAHAEELDADVEGPSTWAGQIAVPHPQRERERLAITLSGHSSE